MDGGKAFIQFLFSIILYNSCSGQKIIMSKFLKTSVIIENAGVGIEPTFTDPIQKIQECSQLCTGDYGCRKYMVTTDITTQDKLCYRYSDGEHCVATESEVLNKESVCYRKLQRSNGTHCVSPVGYYGINCEHIIKDCYDGKNNNFQGISLSYVKPADQIFEVLCNFDYGMTTIQVRRSDSVEVNFTRPWNEYVDGFGNTHSEYWLGLQNIYDLTNNAIFDLHITLDDTWLNCGFVYPNFKLSSNFNALFTSNSYRYTCHDSLHPMMGTIFSTYDKHRDTIPSSCPLPQYGGWWFSDYPTTSYCTGNLNEPRSSLSNGSPVIFKVIMQLVPYIYRD